MKTIIKAALVALALTVGTAAAQAHTINRSPYKSAPYAAAHTHPKGEFKVRRQSDCPRTVIIRKLNKSQTDLYCPVL